MTPTDRPPASGISVAAILQARMDAVARAARVLVSSLALALALVVVVVVVVDVPASVSHAEPAGATAGSGRGAAAVISAGEFHSCALLQNGAVKCWGLNSYGQLGQGDDSPRGDAANEMANNLAPVDLGTGRTATAITGGAVHTCALLDSGTVKCWGNNLVGQLGQGNIEHRGDGAGEMGNNLAPVDFGAGRTATAIAAGKAHTCGLLDDGTVKCWEYNVDGQLGQGDVDHRGDGADELGDNLVPVDLGTGRTATAITAGGFHTCALLDNSTVKCWGFNNYGQLGQSDVEDRGNDPGEIGDNLAPVDLGTGRTATAITAGGLHTCALLDNSTVKCWNPTSQSGHGQPGHGRG